jgi:uncharacterized protein
VKFLVVLVVVVVGLWILLGRTTRRGTVRETQRRPPPVTGQTMVACAHCGVHLPRSDAVADGALVYCSEAHRIAGPSSK